MPQNDGIQTARGNAAPGQKRAVGEHLPLPAQGAKSSPLGLLFGVMIVVALVAGGIWWVRAHNVVKEAARPGAGGKMTMPPVPVVTGKAITTNMPIFLDGLGTVQAYNMVTVHVRVDGELKKVAFKEGQDVQKGELLAEIDPAPYKALYDQAVAKKAQDEATLANARLDLKRDTELVASQVVSGQTFDTQQSLVRQLEASVQADVAAIASAKVNLDYTSISSPLNGRIGIRQVDVGNIVHATDTNGLVVVTQLRPIGVLFTLQEQTLWNIQQHMKTGDMKVLAVDRDNSTVLAQGKLVVIDNQIDTTTGTIRLKAAFPNDDLRLWPGQFVNARLLLTVRTNGLVVPAQVIQRGPAGEYAFVLNRDGTNTFAKVRPVKVAQIDAGLALIDSGLNTGETVVVDGQYKLQDGSPVRVVRSAKAEDEPASE